MKTIKLVSETAYRHSIDHDQVEGMVCPFDSGRSHCCGHACMAWIWLGDNEGVCGRVFKPEFIEGRA